MKYKVGDKVRIKSIDWYNENKDNYDCVYAGNGFGFWKKMVRHCGEIMKITSVKVDPEDSNKGYYFMENSEERWTDEMIEGLVEEEAKPKFKVGDKVLIKDINWYNKNKDEDGDISCGEFIFVSSMSKFCGKILTIDVVFEDGTYLMKEDTDGFVFTNEMFDTFAEEEVERLTGNLSNSLVNEFELPDGYIFKDENGNIINATKIVLEKKPDDKLKLESTKKVREYWSEYARIYIEIYDDEPNECVLTHLYTLEGHRQKGYGKQALIEAELIAKELGCHTAYIKVETNSWMHEWYLRRGYKWYKTADEGYTWLIKNLTSIERKKKEYPKTFEECVHVLEGENRMSLEQMNTFRKLIDSRNAYWKIAGEEMGLGKPWEPDWKNDEQGRYMIMVYENKLHKDRSIVGTNFILVFPTEEMRDAFYENFKELIEMCKELL